jgi:hypothetical protein
MAAAILGLAISPLLPSVSAEQTDAADKITAIGEPGPKAIKFILGSNKGQGEPFRPGDRPVIFLTTDRRAYLTVLAIASDGAVTVALPNKLIRNCVIQPHKTYALFGEDSPLHLKIRDKPSEGKLALYLSQSPLVLNPLQVPADKKWLVISGSDRKAISLLKEKLESLANCEGFNRATILFRGEAGKNFDVRLTETVSDSSGKAIPGGIESSPPETLTGAAGLKPAPVDTLKE